MNKNYKDAIKELYLKRPIESSTFQEAIDLATYALEKQIPYTLDKKDEDTGICRCGRVTEIIDGEYFCKYCGQKVTK